MTTTTEGPLAAGTTPLWERAGLDARHTASPAADIALVPQLLRLKHILVPIDFSETSLKALAYAVPFAEQFGAKITLVHIADLTRRAVDYNLDLLDSAGYNTAAQARLDALIAERIPADLPERAGTMLGVGIPWLEVCNAAKEIEADLIILTTHGYTGLKRVFLGSTAERVVRHAPCPVFIVRGKEHEFV